MGRQPVINLQSPLVDGQGFIQDPWTAFFQQFTQAPSGAMSVIVTASPFSYTTKEPGFINVSGGTVSAVALIRGTITIDVTGQKLIPVQIKDIIKVTFTVLPLIKFLPNF